MVPMMYAHTGAVNGYQEKTEECRDIVLHNQQGVLITP